MEENNLFFIPKFILLKLITIVLSISQTKETQLVHFIICEESKEEENVDMLRHH